MQKENETREGMFDRERRNARVIGREHDPRYHECVPVVSEFERGDLP